MNFDPPHDNISVLAGCPIYPPKYCGLKIFGKQSCYFWKFETPTKTYKVVRDYFEKFDPESGTIMPTIGQGIKFKIDDHRKSVTTMVNESQFRRSIYALVSGLSKSWDARLRLSWGEYDDLLNAAVAAGGGTVKSTTGRTLDGVIHDGLPGIFSPSPPLSTPACPRCGTSTSELSRHGDLCFSQACLPSPTLDPLVQRQD